MIRGDYLLYCLRINNIIRYVELKNPIESVVALNNKRGVIRGVDCRTLGALGMPFAAPALGCSLSREM